MTTVIGSVGNLHRYPVKSMMGEELDTAYLTPRGLFGDRAYVFCDAETSRVVSAKNPRKWPDMFRYSAAYANSPEPGAEMPAIRVILPDGATMLSSSADFVPSLSDKMGRPAKLLATPPCAAQLEEYWTDREEQGEGEVVTDEALPEGTFFDLAVLHLLTTATLDSLRASNSRSRFEPRRFRPNLMIDTMDARGLSRTTGWVRSSPLDRRRASRSPDRVLGAS